jgi:hypothetical protein
MSEPMSYVVLASFGLVALSITLLALLKGWHSWLALKRLDLARAEQQQPRPAIERIELADLKERIRKLEAIAACVDL